MLILSKIHGSFQFESENIIPKLMILVEEYIVNLYSVV